MKKLLLILSLFIAVTFSFQQCKAQVNHLFWAHNNNEFAGYGLLYNWYAASDANFAPAGWHVPTRTETTALINALGGSTVAGGHLKKVGFFNWGSPNIGADNSSGFNGVGGGIRSGSGEFGFFRLIGNIWTSTEGFGTSNGYILNLLYDSGASNPLTNQLKWYGNAVRLIKDDSTDPGTLTDYDGNVYKTVKIGDQVFIASNWKCTHLNNGTSITNVTDNTTWSGLTTGAWCYYNNNSKYK